MKVMAIAEFATIFMNTNEQMGEVEFGNGLLGINGD
jgi:hypothetical protein